MLVKLLELPDEYELYKNLKNQGIKLIRPISPDKKLVCDYVKKTFSEYSVGEVEACFAQSPISMFIAVKDDEIVGFSCYDATAKGFFGPMAVSESMQGKDVGKALLVRGLEAMLEAGYIYAVIGGVGPVNFYNRCCGATLIENNKKSLYDNFLSTKNKK